MTLDILAQRGSSTHAVRRKIGPTGQAKVHHRECGSQNGRDSDRAAVVSLGETSLSNVCFRNLLGGEALGRVR